MQGRRTKTTCRSWVAIHPQREQLVQTEPVAPGVIHARPEVVLNALPQVGVLGSHHATGHARPLLGWHCAWILVPQVESGCNNGSATQSVHSGVRPPLFWRRACCKISSLTSGEAEVGSKRATVAGRNLCRCPYQHATQRHSTWVHPPACLHATSRHFLFAHIEVSWHL